MTTPTDAMLDRVKWKCTVCGEPMGCGCWITLRCSKCKRERAVQRDPTDPKGTALVVCLCPSCCGGDFSMVDYFDKDGKQILVP